MIYNLWAELYEGLKTKLSQSQYNVSIHRIAPQKKSFPIVIFSEITNQTSETATRGLEGVDTVGFEADIYIAPKNSTEAKIFAQDSEISQIVDDYMLSVGFTRMSSTVAPNVDSTIFRRVMRYEANASTRTGKIYR